MSVQVELIGEGFKAKSWETVQEGTVLNRLASVLWMAHQIELKLGYWKAKGYDCIHLMVRNRDEGIPGLVSYTEIASVDIQLIGGK